MRMTANHSMGNIYIFKATEADTPESFKGEFVKAIKFFEKSVNEPFFFNSSRLCLPFYKLFFAISFNEIEAKNIIDTYLVNAEIASVVLGSSKDTIDLIKAVENLQNVIMNIQVLQGMNLNAKKAALRQNFDHIEELVANIEMSAPLAAGVIRTLLSNTTKPIRRLLEEIEKESANICKTADLPVSKKIGCEIERCTADALEIDDPVSNRETFDNIFNVFETWSHSIEDIVKKNYIDTIIADAKDAGTLNKCLSIVILLRMLAPRDESPLPDIFELFFMFNDEIGDIFRSTRQKECEEGVRDTNSKTLKYLKEKLDHHIQTDHQEIDWLDVGCGNGRCLDILDAFQKSITNKIRYHGIDSSNKYFGDAKERASRYNLDARFSVMNAATMGCTSKYDVVSAVLLLHEVDPLCLPYVLRNMITALKDDGILVISDFQTPSERESDVVVWSIENIKYLLENIGTNMGDLIPIEILPSKRYPEDFGFYSCYVKKSDINEEKFNKMLQEYGDFLEKKRRRSKQERDDIRNSIEKALSEVGINASNMSIEVILKVLNEIGYGQLIKVYKIRLLEKQIDFLDKKINELKNGNGCTGVS